MNADPELVRKMFGDEYPEAVMQGSLRLPLQSERRFSRSYHNEEANCGAHISRFMDGSASIELDELAADWGSWTQDQRMDFCCGCGWLREHPDYEKMLRVIMADGSPDELSMIAMNVAGTLPQDEAFAFLAEALKRTPLGQTANLAQGLTVTKHPAVPDLLRKLLARLVIAPGFAVDDDFRLGISYDAVCVLKDLLELGESPAEFEEVARLLANHARKDTVFACRRCLSAYYDWIPEPEKPTLPGFDE